MNEKNKTQTFFYDGKVFGQNLKEVSVDFIETEKSDLTSRWFHGDPGTDLYAWVDSKNNIIKQQLSFVGQVVEWNCLDGIKTGVVIETDLENAQESHREPDEAKQMSEAVQFDREPQNSAVKLALEILNHSQIDDRLRKQLIGNFQDPQHMQSMSPNEFMKRFGGAVAKKKDAEHAPWESLKTWFSQILKKSA
jgi:hypothetical protein